MFYGVRIFWFFACASIVHLRMFVWYVLFLVSLCIGLQGFCIVWPFGFGSLILVLSIDRSERGSAVFKVSVIHKTVYL